MNAFDLAPFLTTGYDNITHRLIYALSDIWHEETSSFHLPVEEMVVTLDDVVCLLDISVIGRLNEERDLTYEHDIFLLQNELLFTLQDAMKE